LVQSGRLEKQTLPVLKELMKNNDMSTTNMKKADIVEALTRFSKTQERPPQDEPKAKKQKKDAADAPAKAKKSAEKSKPAEKTKPIGEVVVDEDFPSQEEPAPAKKDFSINNGGDGEDWKPKPMCPYGANCYRRNPDHLQQFRHPGKK